MRELTEVEAAKALMTEAMAWSVVRWLREKKRVRKAADQANAALDQLDQAVKARWDSELKTAYNELLAEASDPATGRRGEQGRRQAAAIDPQVRLLLKRVKDADEEAYRVRMDAENTFDDAEKQLSTSLAREGCRKAIHSWDLHQKAIRKAEALISSTKTAT